MVTIWLSWGAFLTLFRCPKPWNSSYQPETLLPGGSRFTELELVSFHVWGPRMQVFFMGCIPSLDSVWPLKIQRSLTTSSMFGKDMGGSCPIPARFFLTGGCSFPPPPPTTRTSGSDCQITRVPISSPQFPFLPPLSVVVWLGVSRTWSLLLFPVFDWRNSLTDAWLVKSLGEIFYGFFPFFLQLLCWTAMHFHCCTPKAICNYDEFKNVDFCFQLFVYHGTLSLFLPALATPHFRFLTLLAFNPVPLFFS